LSRSTSNAPEAQIKAKNPGGLDRLAGVWNRSTFGWFSGRPIGERRLKNRDYDNDANYDDVKKLTHRHVHLPARSQCVERKLGVTIGHKLIRCE
jgi:hypothetical protein